MTIAFRCPVCGHKLRAPDRAVGKRSRCKCGNAVVVPLATQADLATPDAPDWPTAAATSAVPGESALAPSALPAPAVPTRRGGRRVFWLLCGILAIPTLLLTTLWAIMFVVGLWNRPGPSSPVLAVEPPNNREAAHAPIEVVEWYTGQSFSSGVGGTISLQGGAEPGLILVAVKVRCREDIKDGISMLPRHSKDVVLIAPSGKEFAAEGIGWNSFSAPSAGGLVMNVRSEIEGEKQPGYVMRGYLFAAPEQDLEAGRMRFHMRPYGAKDAYAAVPVSAAAKRVNRP